MTKMPMNITMAFLQHSLRVDECPGRLDGVSGGMLESVFRALGDSVRAGLCGAAAVPPGLSDWWC